MSYPVGQLVLDAMFEKMAKIIDDGVDGLNDAYNALAPNYGVPADLAIQFVAGANGASPNFARANVMPADWVKTSATKFPFITLFVDRSRNENHQKFHQFSGVVTTGVNVFLSFRSGRVLQDMAGVANCWEETLYTIFNRARNSNPSDQDWSVDGDGAIVYNGDIEIIQSRIERGDEFWSQALAARLTFEVDQRGTT